MFPKRTLSLASICLGILTAVPALAQDGAPSTDKAGENAATPAPSSQEPAAAAAAPTSDAAAPAAAAPTEAAPEATAARSWAIGPSFSASIMHPMTFSAEFHEGNQWGALASYGNFTYSPSASSKIDKLDLKISHFEVVGFCHPWQSAFHVDLGLGQQTIALDATSNQKVASGGASGEKVKLSANFDIASTYLYSGFGWLWRWDSGLILGTGFGLQLPLSSRSNFNAKIEDSAILNDAIKQTSAYRDFEGAVKDAGKKAGMLALPRIEIIRAGWLF